MQKEFKLETVLSVITYYNLTDNYEDILNLYSFMFDKPNMTIIEFFDLYESGKNHILSLYPELLDIYFNPYSIKSYLKKQKEIFTDKIVISKYNEKVKKLQL